MSVVDFHTHILPGIDDGSASTEESIALLRMEAQQGIRHVIATPHFYPHQDSPAHFLQRRQRSLERLQEALAQEVGLPQLSIGAEVYYYSGISNSDVLSQLTIAPKKYILIEMPAPPWSESMYQELADIATKQGITPIIAHIDRYIKPFRTFHIPQRLQELPVLVQANASFFLHRSTRRIALDMLRQDQIHLLGSDCHDSLVRKPNLAPALEIIQRRAGNDIIRRIRSYEQDVLSG